jgi:predicted transposase YdaD
VLESELVQQIMRWDMAILRKSPWYQEIEQRGRREGFLSGIELALEIKFQMECWK